MKINKNLFKELVGWYGMVAILLAYALLSFKLISSNGYIYQLLNLTGAVGIVIISIHKNAKQPAVLNTIWAIVAVISILLLVINR